MLDIAAPLLIALTAWWLSTGLLLFLDRLSPAGARVRFLGATLALAAATFLAIETREWATPAGAYLGFFAGLTIWAWHEMSFLGGWITGPNRAPCPENATGWRRFQSAAAVVIHHELAIAATAGVLCVATLGGANKAALYTFLVLWAMRLSAKLNLFLGVPRRPLEFMPERLTYMASYFRDAPVGGFFIATVGAASGAAGALLVGAMGVGASAYETTLSLLLAALLGLAVLEHLFMALPIEDGALWRWAVDAADAARRADIRTPVHKPMRPAAVADSHTRPTSR